MGSDIFDNNSKPEKPVERPSGLDDLFSRPGKLNGGGDAPGKLNGGGADSPQDKIDRRAAVGGVENAALSGDNAKLTHSLKDAYEKMGGDGTKFQKFGNELAEQLKQEGITVRAGKDAIGIHKNGSADGVEYRMDANLDPQSGKLNADVKAQSYDWATKQDTNKNSADIVKDMSKAQDLTGKGSIKDGAELGKAFDTAYNNGDFSQFNKDMSATFQQAFKVGGMDAVRKLEQQANDAATTPGGGPVVMEENGKLKMYDAEALSPDAKAIAGKLTDQQLKASGIINHPVFGFLHVKDET